MDLLQALRRDPMWTKSWLVASWSGLSIYVTSSFQRPKTEAAEVVVLISWIPLPRAQGPEGVMMSCGRLEGQPQETLADGGPDCWTAERLDDPTPERLEMGS